jgi:glycosyltransferase involved in cell wall biosynthesis
MVRTRIIARQVMKILYDHQMFYRQNYGGVSRYFCELMNQFSHDPGISFILPLRYVQNDNLEQFPQLNQFWSNRYNILYDNPVISFMEKKFRFNAVNFALNYVINNKGESISHLKKQDFDIFHPTYYEPYFLQYLQKKPYVITVYDMIHELFPKYFKPGDQTSAWKKNLIENAGAVIAISENTKQDILKFTAIDPDRVHVIHLGNPLVNREGPGQVNTIRDPVVPKKPYLLFVGGREAYKNFDFFIGSVADILHKNEELQVICAGSLPFSPREKKSLENMNLAHKVHYVKITDASLKNLYKNALALVFPSLYEGFGLPILEAFSSGCPVILSNSSSFPEIGGDAVIYFEPQNSESIVRAVEKVLFSEQCRRELIRKGTERSKLFSWEKTAASTKKVYSSLIFGK